MNEQLKKANELNESIQRIEAFIELANRAQEVDEKNAKQNEFDGVNRFTGCQISAYISTGTQSPRCEKTIVDNDVIVGLMTGGLAVVKEILKDKKEEFTKLFTK